MNFVYIIPVFFLYLLNFCGLFLSFFEKEKNDLAQENGGFKRFQCEE